MEAILYDYYGWDPAWGSQLFGVGAIATPSRCTLGWWLPRMGRAAGYRTGGRISEHHSYSLSCPTDGEIGLLRILSSITPLDIRSWYRTRNRWPEACPTRLMRTRDRLGGSPC